MSRNLNRLNAAANRMQAHHDFMWVFAQVKRYDPPVTYPEGSSAKVIDKGTRALIDWALDHGIEISLPDGWESSQAGRS